MKNTDNPIANDSMAEFAVSEVNASRLKKIAASVYSLPLMAFVILFVVLLLRSQTTALNDPDTFMHITIGKWILLHGNVPDHDIFSFTRSGAPWVPHEWLSDIVLYLIYYSAGWAGLIVMSVICASVSLAYLLRFMLDRAVPVVYALIFLIVSATSLLNHLLARPHILVWPILVVWVGFIIKSNEQKVGPPYWLVVLMVLWANMHGSYILGLVILIPLALEGIKASVLAERQERSVHWLIFIVTAVLASMLTPYGWHGYRLIFELLSQPTLTSIVEWSAPDFSQINAIEIWIFVLLGLTGLGMLRLSPVRLIMLLGLLYEALTHIRYFSIFGLLAPLLIALPFSQQYRIFLNNMGRGLDYKKWKSPVLLVPMTPFRKIVVGTLLAIFSLIVSFYYKPVPPRNIMPESAVNAAIKAGLMTSPVFHDFGYGGYLIYRGIPVYIDGRADMYGSEFTATYNRVNEQVNIGEFKQMLDSNLIAWTLLPANSHLVRYLENLSDWTLLFKDENTVVYKRNGTR